MIQANTQRKTNRGAIFVTPAQTILFAGLSLFVSSTALAKPAPDTATATFRAKCAMCHGADGGGSEVGKSMNVPDLRSPEVQKRPDAQLAEIISDGKGGMPSFKSSLSEGQIHALVGHVRSLRVKK